MKKEQESELKGWKAISEFLGQPVAVLQRWSKEGMPVRRQGRYTTARREDLRAWLGKEAGMKAQAHIHDDDSLAEDLKKSVKTAKSKSRG